jgi:hypothetical protein
MTALPVNMARAPTFHNVTAGDGVNLITTPKCEREDLVDLNRLKNNHTPTGFRGTET